MKCMHLGVQRTLRLYSYTTSDFRWDRETITWQNLLNLLDGEPAHIPSPKNHFITDAAITKDTPILQLENLSQRTRHCGGRNDGSTLECLQIYPPNT